MCEYGGGRDTEENEKILKTIYSVLHDTAIPCEHLFYISRMQKGKPVYQKERIQTVSRIAKWLCAKWNYTPKISYCEHPNAEIGIGSFYCIVMTSHYLLEFMHMDSNLVAFLRRDSREIELRQKRFQEYFNGAMKLAIVSASLPEIQKNLSCMEEKMVHSAYYLENFMCAGSLLSEERARMGKYCLKGDDNFSNLFTNYRKRVENLEKKQFTEIMTTVGVRHFTDTGELPDIPEDFYTHIGVDDRIWVMERWIAKKKAFPDRYHIINTDDMYWSKFFAVGGDEMQSMLWYIGEGGRAESVCLQFQETTICNWIYDYIKSLRYNKLAMSCEEQVRFVEEQIAWLKNHLL